MKEGGSTYDLIMILDEESYLLVDDQTCNSEPKTRIYNALWRRADAVS